LESRTRATLRRAEFGFFGVSVETRPRGPKGQFLLGTLRDFQRDQLAFYASAIAQSFGEPVIGAEMWFPRVESVKVTTRPLDLDRLTEIEETMIEVTNAIRSEQWEPRVGDGCKNCVFKKSCPAWPEGQGAFLP